MESKRLKRLEKNRESARECRRRKKENKERVEAQLASLEASPLSPCHIMERNKTCGNASTMLAWTSLQDGRSPLVFFVCGSIQTI